MIISLIIFGSIGWILVILFLFRLSGKKNEVNHYNIIHLSALLDGRVEKLFEYGLIDGIPVISKKDMNLILSRKDNEREFRVAGDALKIVEKLSVRIEEGDFVSICKKLNASAIIAGADKDELEMNGIRCFDVTTLDRIPRGRVYLGQKIKVKNIEYRYNNARGFMEDGTVVEVEGSLPSNKLLTLDCWVESIVEGFNFRKIWARWKNG